MKRSIVICILCVGSLSGNKIENCRLTLRPQWMRYTFCMLNSTDSPEEGNNSDILFQIHYNEDQHWQQATSA